MIDDELPLVKEYREVAHNAQTLTFLPRDASSQREAIEGLNEFITRLNARQQEAIEDHNEEAANLHLAMRCGCKAVRAELNMWLALKNEEWGDAWSELIDAQDFLKSAQAAHAFARTPDIENLRGKYDRIEKFAFPPQSYLSPGLLVEKYLCSICGEDYGDCEHIAGLPYWGQLCSRIIHDATAREVSVVDEPEDKNCRITHFTTDDGLVRNKMTWEEFEPDDDSKLANLTDNGKGFIGIVLQPTGTYNEAEINALQSVS